MVQYSDEAFSGNKASSIAMAHHCEYLSRSSDDSLQREKLLFNSDISCDESPIDPAVDQAAEIPDDTDSLLDELSRLQEYEAYRKTSQEEINALKQQVAALENSLEQSNLLLQTDQQSLSSWDRLVTMMRLKGSRTQLLRSQAVECADRPANSGRSLFWFRSVKNITSTEEWIFLGLVNLSLVSVLSLMMFAHHLHNR